MIPGIPESVTLRPDPNRTTGGYYVIKSVNPISATVNLKARQKLSSNPKSTSVLSCVNFSSFHPTPPPTPNGKLSWRLMEHVTTFVISSTFSPLLQKRPFQMILTSNLGHARRTDASFLFCIVLNWSLHAWQQWFYFQTHNNITFFLFFSNTGIDSPSCLLTQLMVELLVNHWSCFNHLWIRHVYTRC